MIVLGLTNFQIPKDFISQEVCQAWGGGKEEPLDFHF